MSEAKDVKKTSVELCLGGKKRTIRFGMKAWNEIQERYKGIAELGEAMKTDQPGTIVALVDIGLKREDGETVTTDQLIDWLDEYTIGELLNIAEKIMMSIYESLPDSKKGKRASVAPPDAK